MRNGETRSFFRFKTNCVMKRFFFLTKFGWINLVYGPSLAFLGYLAVPRTDPNAWLAVTVSCAVAIAVYSAMAFSRKTPITCVDIMTLAPLAFIGAAFGGSLALKAIGTDIAWASIGIPAIGAVFGIRFSVQNFMAYPVMKRDYERLSAMLEKNYRPSLLANLDSGSPCEQSIAKDLRRKYAKRG